MEGDTGIINSSAKYPPNPKLKIKHDNLYKLLKYYVVTQKN